MKYLKFYIAVIIISTASVHAGDLDSLKNMVSSDSSAEITFSFVGDLMCHSTQFKWAEIKEDSFDFKPVFREIKPFLDSADFTIGNLETVVNQKNEKYSGYPVFNTPKAYLEALKYAGFDILVTANNHATDGRKEGVIGTINSIKELEMDHAGTFASQEDRDSIRIFSQNGISFTVLSYTYGVNINNLSVSDKYMVNIIDSLKMKEDIDSSRRSGVNLVIVYIHAGSENVHEPTDYQKSVVSNLVEFGADIIISSSPHVLQPIQIFESQKGCVDSVLTAFSLGNFLSNQRWRYSNGGTIVTVSISKIDSTGMFKLGRVEYLPVWVHKGWTGERNEYLLIPSESAEDSSRYPFLTADVRKKMAQFSTDTKETLNKYSERPKCFLLNESFLMASDSTVIK